MRPDGPLASDRPSCWVGWGMLTVSMLPVTSHRLRGKEENLIFLKEGNSGTSDRLGIQMDVSCPPCSQLCPGVERGEIEEDLIQRKEKYWLLHGVWVIKGKTLLHLIICCHRLSWLQELRCWLRAAAHRCPDRHRHASPFGLTFRGDGDLLAFSPLYGEWGVAAPSIL